MFKLKHFLPNDLPNQKFYFYEGEVDVNYGVIELPSDGLHDHWAQRAWMVGFRLDPETGDELSLDEVFKLSSKTAASAVTQESADEGTDGGGLPTGEDGLRESEQPRTESVSSEGLGSSVSDGPAVRRGRNRPASKAVHS